MNLNSDTTSKVKIHPHNHVNQPQFHGTSQGITCHVCNSTLMVRNGTCYLCLNCGETTGCS